LPASRTAYAPHIELLRREQAEAEGEVGPSQRRLFAENSVGLVENPHGPAHLIGKERWPDTPRTISPGSSGRTGEGTGNSGAGSPPNCRAKASMVASSR